MEHALDQAGALGARQAQAVMDNVGQIGAGQRARMKTVVRTRDTRIRHRNLRPQKIRLAPHSQVVTLPQTTPVYKLTFARFPNRFNSEARPRPK